MGCREELATRDPDRNVGTVIRVFLASVIGQHGWAALGGILALLGTVFTAIYCLVLVTRRDQGGIKIKTPFFSIIRESSSSIRKPDDPDSSR